MIADLLRAIIDWVAGLLNAVPGHSPFWALGLVIFIPIAIAFVVAFIRDVVLRHG